MKRLISKSNNPIKISHNKRGFALVITLSLISFVFLLVITLITQIRSDLSFSDVRENQILAKASARMSMMIALGEIQKHLGPDTRISATADIYDERIESAKKYFHLKKSSFTEENFGDLHDNRIIYPNDVYEYSEQTNEIKRVQNRFGDIDNQNVLNAYREDELVDLHSYDELRDEISNQENIETIYKLPLGQRQWTGVWKHRAGWAERKLATPPLPENRDDGAALTDSWSYDSAYDPHPIVEHAWLVSGNEGWSRKLAVMPEGSKSIVREYIEVPDGIIKDDDGLRVLNDPFGGTYGNTENPWADHSQVVYQNLSGGQNNYHHPIVQLPDPVEPNVDGDTDQTAWLLKNPVLSHTYDAKNIEHQKNWKEFLISEPVKVPKTAVFLSKNERSEEPEDDWQERSSSYAYWVGDEGVKTKINIVDPYKEKVKDLINVPNKLKVATEPNIFEGSFSFDFEQLGSESDHIQRKDLISVLAVDSLLDDTSGESRQLVYDDPWSYSNYSNYFYHSITADSFGVLADVRTGGLKRDLSQAFSLPKTSNAWVTDFKTDFIFRDRVKALKNFPLKADADRNEWYDTAGAASIEDENALLAGPRWSVLADYHNLETVDGFLELEAPDKFPRVVGDNSLIFEDRAPNGKLGKEESYTYYNSFREESDRPEPTNHPFLPTLLKLKVSFCPVAMENPTGRHDVAIAISPSVTLWNPYDQPMSLNDLSIDIPFCDSSGAKKGEGLNIDFYEIDVNEYDLYRKWWALLLDLIKKQNPNGSVSLQLNPIPNLGLTNFGKQFGFGTWIKGARYDPYTLYKVFGQLISGQTVNVTHFQDVVTGGNFGDWEASRPPSSLFGIKTDGKNIYHEEPILSIKEDDDHYFPFNSFNEKKDFGIQSLRARLAAGFSLEAGEIVTFGVCAEPFEPLHPEHEETPLQFGEVSARVPDKDIILTAKNPGNIEQAFILFSENGYEVDMRDPESLLIKMDLENRGTAGIVENLSLAENFDNSGNKISGTSDETCITLKSNNRVLAQFTSPRILNTTGSCYSFVSALEENFETLFVGTGGNLPGIGWSIEMEMPGEKNCERSTFVAYNVRALVHSGQHGQGQWLKKGGREFNTNGGYVLTDSAYRNESLPPHDYGPVRFNRTGNAVETKFPNVFHIAEPHDVNLTIDPDFYKVESSLSDRADALSLSENNPVGESNFANYNPAIDGGLNVEVIGEEKTGFLISNENVQQAPYTNAFEPSKYAVMFSTPNKGMELSLLQYRDANLNSYLHGPTYALGNSYATTQVARHRSWGRVQNIQLELFSDEGLTDLEKNDNDREAASQYYKNLLGEALAQKDGLVYFMWEGGWDWTVDFSHGFGAWRAKNVDQINHQNTTYDHSFYLNRALLDGFFLSGMKSNSTGTGNNHSEESSTMVGQRFRPLLWKTTFYQDSVQDGNKTRLVDKVEFTPFSQENASMDSNISGNPRLIAYKRNGYWKDTKTQYDSRNAASGYSYQTTAGDLLLDGAFNINSTSVDAWIAQLSSLRGLSPKNAEVNADETPIVRFLSEISHDNNEWNKFRKLSDLEIAKLAKSIVKQVKIRGPFLSMSDFVNRRLALGPMKKGFDVAKGTRINFIKLDSSDWDDYPEDRYTAQGLRGSVQSAIAESGLNDYEDPISRDRDWVTESWVPSIPDRRYDGSKFYDSSFGLKATAKYLDSVANQYVGQEKIYYLDPERTSKKALGAGTLTTLAEQTHPAGEDGSRIVKIRNHTRQFKSTEFGEAPENTLAVEHMATAANKPGWVMQSDILSPLIPVTSARSDTFTIRVMGETNKNSSAKAWAELVVQRTPDYVKADLDSPHHRPHEPFKDINLNGYWDNNVEHWLDLNRNGEEVQYPDLPGVGSGGRSSKFRDGMYSDKQLNSDDQEEASGSAVSMYGINQRFGRKFKIVRFRWLRERDV